MKLDVVGRCGWIIFIVVFANFVSGYGSRWQVGRYGMPFATLADDGRHYQDGSEADPVTIWLVRHDVMEECLLGGLGFGCGVLGLSMLFGYWHDWRRDRAIEREFAERQGIAVPEANGFSNRILEQARRIARRMAGLFHRGI